MALTPRPVNVTLRTVRRNGQNVDVLTLDPVKVALRSSGDEVVWRSTGGSLTVKLKKNGTPFSTQNYACADGGEIHTHECSTKAERVYSYELTMDPTNGGSAIVIDPEVDVDDNTPPPPRKSGKKSASRKKARSRRKPR